MTVQSRHILEAEGVVVLGNGQVLKASEKLGAGSFGAVWRLQGEEGSFALKETISDSDPSFQQSVSEATLLMKVSQDAANVGTPKYVGHEGARVGERLWRMRLMMSLVKGDPLDLWMHRVGVAIDFHAAAMEARELLTQMTAAMVVVEKFCVHRDISSHNIMIEETTSGRPKYCLIDLGLAVVKSHWLAKWRDLNLAGDCKYWPPAAWLLFTYGPSGVRPFSPEANQYTQGLDVFSLGISCVELLMSRTPKTCPVSGHLRVVWTDYWEAAATCWRDFYCCFKGQGDWESLRSHLNTHNTPCMMMDKLHALIEAIDRLALDLKSDCVINSLLRTLRFMLTPNSGSTDFKQVQVHLNGNGNLARYTHKATFSHRRVPTVVGRHAPREREFRLPVLSDFRTPFLLTRPIGQFQN